MTETRKLAAILASDVVGFSRLTGADEDRTLARLRALRSDLIDPTISVHNGRVVKRTGDGAIVEFRSVVDAVRCAIEMQNAMVERNTGVPEDRRIEFRIGIHLGDVVEEADGDLMGDGVNIAARLEGVALPGAICLSEDAYRQVKARLDLAVTDLGATQLKNIAEPVRVYSLQVTLPAQAKPPKAAGVAVRAYRVKLADGWRPPPAASPLTRFGVGRPRNAWIGAAVLLLIVAGGAWYVAGGPKSAATVAQQSAALPTPAEPAKRPPHLSIVVLPFANLSGDANQDYFADGITENLTTDLSRLRGSFVIARNTAFTFKGKYVDAREIGKELGVRYLLEGSVQRDQSQVRVNAQLIDTENGGHVWADRFDGRLAGLFQMQDEIVASLASQLGAELIADEAQRAQRASNPDSMDLYFQGQAWANKGINPDNMAQARSFFERALALDPNNLSALLARVNVDLSIAINYMAEDRAARLAAIEATLIKVLSQAPNDAFVHARMGTLLTRTNRGAQGIAEYERALALNPNLASVHANIGFAWLVNGHPEETEGHVNEAMRLSPRDTFAYTWLAFIGTAKVYSGADEDAVSWYRRSIELNRGYPISHLYLAAALELLGRHDEARTEAQAALALDPKFSIRRFRAGAQSDNPVFLKQRERLIQAMQKAGVPEG